MQRSGVPIARIGLIITVVLVVLVLVWVLVDVASNTSSPEIASTASTNEAAGERTEQATPPSTSEGAADPAATSEESNSLLPATLILDGIPEAERLRQGNLIRVETPTGTAREFEVSADELASPIRVGRIPASVQSITVSHGWRWKGRDIYWATVTAERMPAASGGLTFAGRFASATIEVGGSGVESNPDVSTRVEVHRRHDGNLYTVLIGPHTQVRWGELPVRIGVYPGRYRVSFSPMEGPGERDGAAPDDLYATYAVAEDSGEPSPVTVSVTANETREVTFSVVRHYEWVLVEFVGTRADVSGVFGCNVSTVEEWRSAPRIGGGPPLEEPRYRRLFPVKQSETGPEYTKVYPAGPGRPAWWWHDSGTLYAYRPFLKTGDVLRDYPAIVHFADGSTAVVRPSDYGQDMRVWVVQADPPARPGRATIVAPPEFDGTPEGSVRWLVRSQHGGGIEWVVEREFQCGEPIEIAPIPVDGYAMIEDDPFWDTIAARRLTLYPEAQAQDTDTVASNPPNVPRVHSGEEREYQLRIKADE